MSDLIEACWLWWAKLRPAVSWWLTLASTLIGLTAGVAGLWPLFLTGSQSLAVQSYALSAIAIMALLILAWREAKLGQQRKIAATLDRQCAASEKVRDLYVFLRHALDNSGQPRAKSDDLARARSIIGSIADDYASIFSQITATRCRVCVKVISNIDDIDYIFVLKRDEMSSSEFRKHDEKRQENLYDKLRDNNFLMKMFDAEQTDEGFFFSNNLIKERSYESSSIHYWEVIDRNPRVAPDRTWRLPYKSSIVVPVRQEPNDRLGILKGDEKLFAFVNVDSPSRRAFSKRRDVHLAKLLANSLFPIIQLYAELNIAAQLGDADDVQA